MLRQSEPDTDNLNSGEAESSQSNADSNGSCSNGSKSAEQNNAGQKSVGINPEPNLTNGQNSIQNVSQNNGHISPQEKAKDPTEALATPPETGIAPSNGLPDSDLSRNGLLSADNTPDSDLADSDSADSDSADSDSADSDSADSDREEGLWPVFRNRNFLTLWSGQVFSQIADKIYLVLMIAIISSNFKSPGQTISGWVSAIMIAFTIPAVLFGSLAGVYVDRWEKKPVLVATNLLRGLLVALIPILLWATDGWNVAELPVGFYLLLLVTFLVSTLTQFFAPAEQAVIPLIVKERNLLPANSLYTTTMMASVIVGFAVGEPLLALADTLLAPIDRGSGVGKSVLVGVSYAIAGSLLMLMTTPEIKVENPQQPHVWQDIKDGLAYLKTEVLVRNALIQLTVLFSVFAALAVLAVRLAEVIPSIRSSQFGFLLAAGGVGLAIGAVAIGQFGQRFSRPQLGLMGSLGMTAMLSGLSLAPPQLWPSLGLIGVLGFFGAMVGIPMQTTIQETTPEDMRGKVFGLQNNVVNIALSLPLALAGIAETFLGLRVVFGFLAVLVAVSGFLTWSLVSAALKNTGKTAA